MSDEVVVPLSDDAGRPEAGKSAQADRATAQPAELGHQPAAPAQPATMPVPPRDRPHAGRLIALVVLVVVGLAGIGGGGAALARELTRGPTSAEKAAAAQQEIASRWQRLPAGEIFTPTLGYNMTDSGTRVAMAARLVGIAPAADCSAALDPAVAALLDRYGCVTVLRATYVDYSGTLAVTVGIAVMTSTQAASQAVSVAGSLPASAGVRTFPLPGTVADQFGDAQRGYFSAPDGTGTGVFLAADGYSDGRPGSGEDTLITLQDLATGVVISLQNNITTHPERAR
jgi:hypothetical protein